MNPERTFIPTYAIIICTDISTLHLVNRPSLCRAETLREQRAEKFNHHPKHERPNKNEDEKKYQDKSGRNQKRNHIDTSCKWEWGPAGLAPAAAEPGRTMTTPYNPPGLPGEGRGKGAVKLMGFTRCHGRKNQPCRNGYSEG